MGPSAQLAPGLSTADGSSLLLAFLSEVDRDLSRPLLALRLDARVGERSRGHGERVRCVGRLVGQLAEGCRFQVRDVDAGLVMARVLRSPGHAAVVRGSLHALCSGAEGKQADGDASVDKALVVRAAWSVLNVVGRMGRLLRRGQLDLGGPGNRILAWDLKVWQGYLSAGRWSCWCSGASSCCSGAWG